MKQTILSASIASIFKNAATDKIKREALRFDCSPEDFLLMQDIASRGAAMAKSHGVIIDWTLALMDICAVHRNGQPLKLLQFLLSGDGDFAHDFTMIGISIDRSTGKLHNSAKLIFAETKQ